MYIMMYLSGSGPGLPNDLSSSTLDLTSLPSALSKVCLLSPGILHGNNYL